MQASAISRMSPCPCGSGKRYKNCCGAIGASATTPPSAATVDGSETLQMALELHQRGDLDAAERAYRSMLEKSAHDATALHYLGVCNYQRGQLAEAAANISLALQYRHDEPMAQNNLGLVLKAMGHNQDAGRCFDRAIEQQPGNAAALNNRGLLRLDCERLDDAIADFAAAVSYAPGMAEAHNNLAKAQVKAQRYAEAVASWERALAIKPDLAEAHFNRAEVLFELQRHEEAIASYEEAAKLNPDLGWLAGSALHARMHICDWRDFWSAQAAVLAAVTAGRKVVKPLPLIALASDMAQQQRCAAALVAEAFPAPQTAALAAYPPHARIRIAYLSADFRAHPVSQLIAQLIERHDRQQFEVFGVYVGPDVQDPWRARMEKAFDHFLDVRELSDANIAAKLRDLEIDIVIDLMGHTRMARLGVLAARAAPVQVTYLGYPGTTGAPFVDYLIADHTLIDVADRVFYSEKVVALPHSFQVNDDTKEIAAQAGTRADHGLPATGFVFCCFNNSFKITPAEFDVWMRLLKLVEGSALWLSGHNAATVHNLRAEALARGVDPSRLVFARRTEALADHYARHQHADLFLDTFCYNAHTTASDALWSGLPVLTLMGRTYASRVAASLLRAIQLPELITHDVAAYESLALELARHPDRLAALRGRLLEYRRTQPLFNSQLFRQHIESAYRAIHARAKAGLAPDHIAIAADAGRDHTRNVPL